MLKIIQFPNGKYALEHSYAGFFESYADREDLRKGRIPFWYKLPMYYYNAEFDSLEELEELLLTNSYLNGKLPEKKTIKIL